MAITVKHLKVSAIPDAGDDTLVEPSDWNADHTLTGTIDVANGGTGQTTANAAFNALAPSQTGNTGKYLTTDGTNSSWATVSGGSGTVTSVAATAGTGISVTGSPITTSGTLTITNTAPDQTVVLTAGTGISTSGTYPNFTITNTSPSLGGDVVGPASATDNAIARFDSTTGKLIQNSTVTINDNGTLEAVNGISFDTTPTSAPTAEGSLSWNSSDGTLDLVMRGGNVVQQIGEEQYYTVRNETGSTIANGTPVMANGVTAGSGRITVTPAIANGSIDELRFIGLTTESITNGINGYVTSFGYVRGLDTRGTPYGETWAEGDVIYVSPTTAGYLTNVEPTAPNLKIVVAIVTTRNQTSGVLLVRPTAYPHITHLSDVNISSPTSGNLLIYDAPQNRWENADLTASTGISVTNGAGSVTITNTAPDQVVSLTGAGTTSISGTYPNFTVTSNDQFTGTVTSVTGTAPVVSSGGNTPAISMAAATGSVDGYLTSTDWTTFNNKGSGTVTAVSVASANGFAGSSSGGATPALTLTTSITGVLKGNATAISAATAGTDYSAGTSALATGIIKSTTSTGALTIAVAADFPTLNQNTTGSAGSVANALTAGTGLTATATYNGSAAITFNATGTTINSQSSGYTLVATDAGKTVSITTGGVTIPNAVMAAGNIVSIYNNSGSSQTITQGSSLTLQFAGQSSSTTGNRTLGLYGLCTIVFISSSNAVITGSGIT
jgi:hypothetical protein